MMERSGRGIANEFTWADVPPAPTAAAEADRRNRSRGSPGARVEFYRSSGAHCIYILRRHRRLAWMGDGRPTCSLVRFVAVGHDENNAPSPISLRPIPAHP